MTSPSESRPAAQVYTSNARVLVADLSRNIIVHGPQPGHRVTFAASTRLYSHLHQGVPEALSEVFDGSFATSGLRFGVAMLIGIDPTDPPDDVEHLIDVWLETCVAFNTVAISEIVDGNEGLLCGMLSAWIVEHGPVQARGRA